jgi:molybdate transport system regulatory protein
MHTPASQSTSGISGTTDTPQPSQSSEYLTSDQLDRLAASFEEWVQATRRADILFSRKRIRAVYLIIRYAGAKLGEIIHLNVRRDIDLATRQLSIAGAPDLAPRSVGFPEDLALALDDLLGDPKCVGAPDTLLAIDPGHIRRKFYERAEACAIPRHLANPGIIRRSRAMELVRDQVPLPVVKRIMGMGGVTQTSAMLAFSDEDMQQIEHHFLARENLRKSSARNSFFGKVAQINTGDIQTEVQIKTLGGHTITSVITGGSSRRLNLQKDMFLTAEIKAPWVILTKEDTPLTSAANALQGIITAVNIGKITTEHTLTLDDGTEICAITTSSMGNRLHIHTGDRAWALFDAFAVILHLDTIHGLPVESNL